MPINVLQEAWRSCGCPGCHQWRRVQRGRKLCATLCARKPIAEELHGLLFHEEPLEWKYARTGL